MAASTPEKQPFSPAAQASAAAEGALWHGQAQMAAVKSSRRVIARGEGAHVWDENGHRALDLPASLWYCNVGHGRAEIADAAAAQMRQVAAYSNFQRFANRPALELAERIVDLAPLGSDAKVFLTSGGSDAVDAATKLARRYWAALDRPDKRAIVSRELAYHGLHGIGTSIGGLAPNRDGFGPLLEDVTRVPHSDWQAFERLAQERGEGIAAFFCEPVIGSGGIFPPGEDYLRQVQRICREHEILFVVDEVITGFGRLGRMFASDRFELEPDLLLFAKGVSSGYLPVGGMVASAAIAEPFWREGSELAFRHGLTYQAHAAAAAAALANLEILEREQLVARAASLEGVLARELRKLESDPRVVEVRTGVGLLGGVQLPDPALANEVIDRCWERNVLVRAIGLGETIQISPPFVIEEAEIESGVAVLADAIAASPE